LTFIFNFIFQSGNSKANFDTKYQIKLQAVTNHMIYIKPYMIKARSELFPTWPGV